MNPRVYRLPKAGATATEYEDAVAWNQQRRRFAVADGASASAFARLWAQLLVQAYVSGRLRSEHVEQDLAPLQARWAARVEARDLPWYAHEQVRRGAFAALVGLTVYEDQTWTSLAVGDCCLFQVRDEHLVAALPLSNPDEFANQPLLLGSRPAANARLRTEAALVTAQGTWQPGDTFLLMSDALAATFLREGSALSALTFNQNPKGFRRWINSKREARALRNDDVSLLWLALPSDAAA